MDAAYTLRRSLPITDVCALRLGGKKLRGSTPTFQQQVPFLPQFRNGRQGNGDCLNQISHVENFVPALHSGLVPPLVAPNRHCEPEVKMTVSLSLLGIVLFLITKRFMFQADSGKSLYVGFLEVPVDANLVGFMLAIATISQLEEANSHASITILGSTILMNLSVLIWRYSSSLMSDRDGEVYISRPRILIGLSILNVALSISAIALPIYALGA